MENIQLEINEISAILDALNNRDLTYATQDHINDHRRATVKMLSAINNLQILNSK